MASEEKFDKDIENIKFQLQNEIIKLCSIATVSGFESRATEKVSSMYRDRLDSFYCDAVGNHILLRSCGRKDAVKIMIDAHLDEIGFVVTEVLDGGFLRIANIGGIDRAIIQGAEVTVLGDETLHGVIASTPPHLKGDDDKLPTIDKALVDVGLGYSKEELEKIACVGTPVIFDKTYTSLKNGRLAGPSFDNKACGAIAICAVASLEPSELAGDVYITLSCREETASRGGAYLCANRISPDYAMVIDVNLANAPDVSERESVPMGEGISISYSSSTSRALTRECARLCKEGEIPFTPKAEPSSTGTNAVAVNIAGGGVPVVDIGLPLRNMHTYNEIIALDDCYSLYRFIRAFVTSRELAEGFAREEGEI